MSAKKLVPLLLGLGLFGYFLTFTTSQENLNKLWMVVRKDWFFAGVLTIPYLLGRLFVWSRLLKEEGVSFSIKKMVVAFAVGEAGKSLPVGIYLESFLLNRFNSGDREETLGTYASTTAMLGIESALAVPAIFILGIPNPVIKYAVLGGVLFWVVFLFGVYLIAGKMPGRLKGVGNITVDFFKKGSEIINKKTILLFFPTLVYMFSYVLALYYISNSLGVMLSLREAAAVFAFFVVATILIPIPTELGIVELSGLSALTSFGISKGDAGLVMLSLRVIFSGAVILISGIVVFFLRREFSLKDKKKGVPRKIGGRLRLMNIRL